MILTKEQIYNIFVHRKDVFATQQKTGAYFPTKRPITLQDIKKHLEGEVTIGLYCLKPDNTVKWACVDIDGQETESELRRMEIEANSIYNLFPDFARMLEFSGRRGYHIWIFPKQPLQAEYIKTLVKSRLNRVGLNRHEVFPKQTELNETRKYGNLVKIPCAIHKVSGKRSQILKMEGL
ncbi:TOTE conflict system archaeo-eukaryotic primase domain-containing protein [Oceanihabitans sediminis]|uniref:TOTE conflict system archaeo-eukaryotic primase domain-containing protein n=1 Tax=Oceanihabitans sediminis TaxID=1812012 RepID=UPI00299E1E29|nr:hypothetical protein [Oceanihabitans sediminis]MDX1279353.1 hypothetical protein [Oceanihabitans sediminis]